MAYNIRVVQILEIWCMIHFCGSEPGVSKSHRKKPNSYAHRSTLFAYWRNMDQFQPGLPRRSYACMRFSTIYHKAISCWITIDLCLWRKVPDLKVDGRCSSQTSSSANTQMNTWLTLLIEGAYRGKRNFWSSSRTCRCSFVQYIQSYSGLSICFIHPMGSSKANGS